MGVVEWEGRGTTRFLGGCGHAARAPCRPPRSAFPLLLDNREQQWLGASSKVPAKTHAESIATGERKALPTWLWLGFFP